MAKIQGTAVTRREVLGYAAAGLYACAMFVANPFVARAETSETQTGTDMQGESPDAALEASSNGGITFRGIPWYSTKSEVDSHLQKDGIKVGSGSDEDIYRMAAVNYANVTVGKDRVDGGGVRAYYSGASVAGYDNVRLYACYMWPIENEAIVASQDEALFYLAWYAFKDYGDYDALYVDLKSKIDGMYGSGVESSDKYHTWAYWYDQAEGNMIRLQVDTERTYATLAYMAGDADQRLDEVEVALTKMLAAEEEALRKQNSTNTSGL